MLATTARVPVTAAAGRSGVCGASVPVFGGVLLDLTTLAGIVDVDTTSMLVDVLPGTFGDVFEDELRAEHGVTSGHWPQSIALSTVGGWLACRGAGQLSTRYGKIEDIVPGPRRRPRRRHDDHHRRRAARRGRARPQPALRRIRGHARHHRRRPSARAPDPAAEGRAAYAFASFTDALDAMRRILQRGATPAVLRLYDAIEADRTYHTGDANVLLVLDEGDAHIVDATDAHRRGRVRDRRAHRRRARRAVARAPQRRLGAGGADPARASSSTRWRSPAIVARAARDLRAARRRRSARSSTRSPRRRTRATRTPTAGASTSRSRASRPRTNGSRTTERRGTPASARCSPPVAR